MAELQKSPRVQENQRLLRDFDQMTGLVRGFLANRYGEKDADALVRLARKKYEGIIPQVPRIEGVRAKVLNRFLRGTGQEIAVYQAVSERGGTPPEAWEICHEAIRKKMSVFPRWRRWLMRRFHVLGARETDHEASPGRATRSSDSATSRSATSAGKGTDFDIGVDYVRCGNLELARKLGAEAFAPYVCMSDVAMSDALGWGLIRTQTLADGCSHCDFRFKRGGETQISSKTPEVQETIERIARRSSE